MTIPVQWRMMKHEERRQVVVALLHEMSEDGFGPSAREFDAKRPEGVPKVQRVVILMEMSWAELIKSQGLKIRRKGERGRKFQRNQGDDWEHLLTERMRQYDDYPSMQGKTSTKTFWHTVRKCRVTREVTELR